MVGAPFDDWSVVTVGSVSAPCTATGRRAPGGGFLCEATARRPDAGRAPRRRLPAAGPEDTDNRLRRARRQPVGRGGRRGAAVRLTSAPSPLRGPRSARSRGSGWPDGLPRPRPSPRRPAAPRAGCPGCGAGPGRRGGAPLSSASVHSRLAVPARGWTRTDLTRPATLTRRRHCTSPIGVDPLARVERRRHRRRAHGRRAGRRSSAHARPPAPQHRPRGADTRGSGAGRSAGTGRSWR